MVISFSQLCCELTKKFLLVVIALFICSKLNAQCSLSVQNVNYCNNSAAVLGIGAQLTILGIPSNNAITSYSWTGPNGFTSTSEFPIIPAPAVAGNYTLTVQAPGCGSVSQVVSVSSVTTNCPSAAFTPSQTTICDGETINFNNQSAGSNTYFWLFGDGNTSNSQSPSHSYNVPTGSTIDQFNVTLVSVNSTDYMNVISNTVNVVEIPEEPLVNSSQYLLYNNQDYLVQCTELPSDYIFINGLLNEPTGWAQNYTINWGDGMAVESYTAPLGFISHEYTLGLFNLTISMIGPNGCLIAKTYKVFVGNTPAVSLGNLGLSGCAPFTINFPINAVGNNIEGTTYSVTFSDGGPSQSFSHPPPPFFTHTFIESSCGETSPAFGYPNAFSVSIVAQNPCQQSFSDVAPIYISTPPIASFTASPTPVCVNTAVNVNSTADPGTNVNSSGCNTNHGMLWSVSPATGWNLTSGNLGSVNGQPTSYTAWTSGSTQLSIIFSMPGTYVITQRIRNSCGEDVTTRTVCVVPPVTAAFNLHFNDQCAPETITTDNLTTPLNTCVQPTYLWSINPSAPFAFNIPPFTSSSFEPAWTLNVDTTYIITLAATNACGTTYDDTSFTIVAPPTVNILQIPPGCAPYIVDPSVTYYDGGGSIVMQEWSIDNGPWIVITPSEPVDHLPISFPVGPHTISVRITNECGTATDIESFIVTSPPEIDLTPFSLCSGVPEIINGIIPPVVIGTGAVPYSYNWSGSGIFPTNISNPTITLTNSSIPPIASVEVINLIITDVLGCTDTANVNVTVNPLPTLSALPNSKCIGSPAVPLSVNSNIPGTTFVWTPANSLSSAIGSLVQANPSTSTTYTIVGLVTSTGCISSTTVDMTVNPLPIVDAQAPLQLCAQGAPTQILQGIPAGGIWSDPTPLTGIFVSPDMYSTSANPGLDTLIYTYTDLNGCTNFDSVQVIILTLEAAVVGTDFSLCQNASPQLLNSGVPIGGSWSGSGVILQLGSYYFDPSIAAVGNHTLTYTINAGTSCESSDSQTATVFQIPVVNAGLDLESCSGINATISSNVNLGLQPYQYAWSPSTGVVGPTNTSQLLVEHLNQSVSDQVFTYILIVTDDNGCNVSDDVNLTVHPLPLVHAGGDQIVCTQPISYTLSGYSPTSNGIGSWSGSSQLTGNVYTPQSSAGFDTLIYTFTDLYGCVDADTITISNITAVFPDAGTDTSACLNLSPFQLNAISPLGGVWSGSGVNSAGLFNPSVAGAGIHQIIYTVFPNTTCQTRDTIQIEVFDIPNVDAGLPITFCSGDTVSLNGTIQGGAAPFSIQWSPSTSIIGDFDTLNVNVSIINITAVNSLTPVVLQVIDENACVVIDQVTLTVRPNPIVNAGPDTTICYSVSENYLLTGFSPAGGIWTNFAGNSGTLSGFAFQTGGIGADSLSYTFTDVFGCLSSDTIVINVTSPISIDVGPDLGFCISDAIITLPMPQPASPPATYTAFWTGAGVVSSSGAFTFNPTLAGPGNHTLNYSYEFGATCDASDALDIFVGSLPQVNISDFSLCFGDTVNLDATLVDNTGNAPFNYSWQPLLNLSNTAVLSPDFYGNQVSASPLILNYSLDVLDSMGCLVNFPVTITLNPLPIVDAGLNDTLCNQPIPFTLSGYSPTIGGTGVWTGNNLVGDVYTSNGLGNQILIYTFTDVNGCINDDQKIVTVVAPIYPNAGPDRSFCLLDLSVPLLPVTQPGGIWSGAGVSAIAGTFEFTPLTAGIGSHSLIYTIHQGTTCETHDTLIYKVFPMPQVDAGVNLEMCSGDTVSLAGSASLGTLPYQFSWSPITGILSGGSTLSPQVRLLNSSLIDITQNYTVQLTDSAGCIALDSMQVLIHALPVVDAGLNDTLCNQPIPFTLNGYGPTLGGTGVWTGNNLVGDIYTPNGLGNQTLTYTFTDVNGCVNDDQKVITVVAPIYPNAGPDRSFCLLDASVPLLPVTQPGGVWSGAGVSLISGAYNFTALAAGVGSHALIYTIHQGTTCETHDTLIYKVFPMPQVDAGLNLEMCSGDTVTLSGSALLGTLPYQFSWSPVTGILSGGSTLSPQVQLTNTTLLDITQSYIILLTDSGGCTATDSMQVLVHPLPVVNAGLNDTLCNQPIPFTLSGYSPILGGTGIWTGNNLAGDVYTPNGLGNQTLTYTFTDVNGCVNDDQKIVTVVVPIYPDAGPDLELCASDSIIVLVPTTYSGGIWTGAGVAFNNPNYVFNPLVSAVGQFSLTYTILPNTTCQTKDSIIVTVFDLPEVKLGLDLGFCIDDPCFQITDFIPTSTSGGVPATGIFLSNGIISTAGLFCPSQNLPGDQMVIYQYSDPITTCVNRDTMIIQVHPNPVPLFDIDSLICINTTFSPVNLSLGDTIYGGSLTYNWIVYNYLGQEYDFYSGPQPQISIADTGNYVIHLSLSTLQGCQAEFEMPITLIDLPTPAFVLSANTGCAPLSIAIINNSTGVDINYLWNVDGFYSNSTSLPDSILFTSPVLGDTLYLVQLTISNQCGDSEIDAPFIARPTPVSVPLTNEYIGCSPFVPIFTNSSYGSPGFYQWVFSDGFISTDTVPPSHGFIAIDNDTTFYSVTLIAENACGIDSSSIDIIALPNTVVAFFNTIPQFGCAPLAVQFSNFSSGANSYTWNFDDGSPNATTYNANHVFQNGGVYQISMIATDGCSIDTAHATVNVFPKPDIQFLLSENVICEGNSISVSNLSQGAAAYLWNFDNGASSTSFEPSYVYTQQGNYAVQLIGYSPVFGCPDTLSLPLIVQAKPQINISIDPMMGCMPLLVTFTNSTLWSTSMEWDFGNGSTSNQFSASTNYFQSGDYDVHAIAHNYNFTNNLDCPVDTQIVISVFPKPESVFTLETNASCGDSVSVFVNNLSNGGSSYLWSWQTSNSFEFEPLIHLTEPGYFPIQLVVSNQFACADTSLLSYRLTGQPIPVFDADPSIGCMPLNASFNSLTPYGDHWEWDFGDGNTSIQGPVVQHEYSVAGIYTVSLRVANDNVCFADTIINQMVVVHPRANADFDVNQTTINTDYPVILFENLSTNATIFDLFPGDGSHYSDFINQHIYQIHDESNMEIVLIANNQFNCPDTTFKVLNVEPSSDVYVPNSFTPNGDGRNDLFGPVFDGDVTYFDFLIFDRWGHIIFETHDVNEKWNGTFKNLDKEPIKEDVYVYKIVFGFGGSFESYYQRVGNVTLIY